MRRCVHDLHRSQQSEPVGSVFEAVQLGVFSFYHTCVVAVCHRASTRGIDRQGLSGREVFTGFGIPAL